MKRLRVLLMALFALLLAVPTPSATAQTSLNGAGATFPAPLYTKWFNEYANKTGVQVNYQAIGSGGGIKAITDKTADFGATDGIMTEEQQAAAPDVLHIPMTSGAVVLAYNVPGIESGLKLTPEALSGIFLGTISRWNDPAIMADNPGLALPDKDIITIHRSDGSGTTFVFTNYLTKVSPAWAAGPGNATSVNWPNGLGGQGNAGVAGEIKANEGAIGYVELTYALQNKISYATMLNASGNWVEASVASTTAAADGIALPDDTKIMITNSPNPSAYPIASFTWLLVNKTQSNSAKGKVLVDMLNWAVTDGQAYTTDLSYAPLSPAATQKAQALISSISY